MKTRSAVRKTAMLAALAAATALASATLASPATGCETTPPPPEYVTVAWVMPWWDGDGVATWPQSYSLSIETSVPDLGALDDHLLCDVPYQVDVYNNNDVTDSLIAGGYLNGPNDPQESLIPGGWGMAYKVTYFNCTDEPPIAPDPEPTEPPTTVITPPAVPAVPQVAAPTLAG